MNGLAVMMTMAVLGVDYGWQPGTDGQLEYIVQIEPALLESMKNGEKIVSEIHPDARGARRFVIQVGTGDLPRKGLISPATSPTRLGVQDGQPGGAAASLGEGGPTLHTGNSPAPTQPGRTPCARGRRCRFLGRRWSNSPHGRSPGSHTRWTRIAHEPHHRQRKRRVSTVARRRHRHQLLEESASSTAGRHG